MIDRPKQPDAFDEALDAAFPSEHPTSPRLEPASVEIEADADAEERPTVSPPFDLEEFARTSDSKVRASKTPMKAAHDDMSTKPPPANLDAMGDEDDLPDEFTIEIESSGKMPVAPRPPQITMTDEGELETARLQSLFRSEPPPGGREERSGAFEKPTSILPPTVQYPAEEAGFEDKDPFANLPPSAGKGDKGDKGKTGGLPLQDMRDRLSLGDYSGALELAESVLAIDPVNAEAIACAEECRATLQQMYTARIGPMDRVPVVMVPREQLRWLSIDHRAGFLLSHVDGVSSLEMILDVSGMPTLDALRILCELAQQKVISFR